MPLLSTPTVPPGFAPRSVVAPEVFEEMQMYMNCTDPEERRLREYKMKKALQDLSSNPGAQSSYLRLEDQPIISGVQNKNVGRVFDFRTAEAEAVGHQNIGEGSNISPLSTHERAGEFVPSKSGAAFSIGHDNHSASGTSGGSKASKRRGTSWKRFKQTPSGARKETQSGLQKNLQDVEETNVKRKAREEMEVSSKMSKQAEDKWIMDGVPPRPVNRQTFIDINLKVETLLDDTGNWNVEMLTELFPPNEVVRIRQMMPGDVNDGFVWAYSQHGAYTVKTGYDLILQGKMESAGAVAVAERLNSRGLGVESACKLCNDGAETINHVLFQCMTASRIWADVGVALPAGVLQHSLEENVAYVFDAMQDLSKTEAIRHSIPWVLWLIWKNRNSVIYAHVQESSARLLRAMFEEVEQWFELNKVQPPRAHTNTRLESEDKWNPPENGVIKCNIHANWRNAHLLSGVAWIARDQIGKVSYHARDAITHAPNRFVAELRSVIWALSSLLELGVSRVTVVVDYHEVRSRSSEEASTVA
uniref:RNase H type-1 domain-containing protein n=1 Tax=Brassica oleracea TaxID=3712 RepID=A0A3P6FH63_BRAOL|nr:unnamed protein product [Brassica oleracea]